MRTRLASTGDAAAPDSRPLWVLCELMRRCSEAAAGIVGSYVSEGALLTDLEAPVRSAVAGAERPARVPAQPHQALQELLLCIVCLAAVHGGLAIADAEEALCAAACTTGNDAVEIDPSGGARRAMTCLSAAPSPYAHVDTAARCAGGGSLPAAHASHAHVVREVLYLCRSHLEHVMWALAVRLS